MIHRHSSVASRPRNARGMLRKVSHEYRADMSQSDAARFILFYIFLYILSYTIHLIT
jgi:hypothetical protein